MPGAEGLQATLLPGARELLRLHARELPQRDDLCGAFCGSLALRAGLGTDAPGLDQDGVALAAGTVVADAREPGILPAGETGRRDYRLRLPAIADEALSGTTTEGIVRALGELSGGRLAAIPYSGPWSPDTLAGLFDAAAALPRPVALLANHATRHLWGSAATPVQLLEHLCAGSDEGPAPDWDVGHFANIVARVHGPAGSLYVLADTYPSLGHAGVHAQPGTRLALALARPGGPGGGVIVAAHSEDARAVRDRARALGLIEAPWDNGTALPADAP